MNTALFPVWNVAGREYVVFEVFGVVHVRSHTRLPVVSGVGETVFANDRFVHLLPHETRDVEYF